VRGVGRRVAGGDAGVSVAEVLVAAAVGLVVSLGVVQVFASTLRSADAASTHLASSAEVRHALDVMSRRLQLATRAPDGTDGVVLAQPTSVRFHADLFRRSDTQEQPPTLVEYTLVGDCLRETLTPAGGPARSTCLARGWVNDGGATELFRYFSDPRHDHPATAGQPVVAVQVALSVKRSASHRTAAVQARTRVTMTNLVGAS
jgi:type II secretory pathway component PulJ